MGGWLKTQNEKQNGDEEEGRMSDGHDHGDDDDGRRCRSFLRQAECCQLLLLF